MRTRMKDFILAFLFVIIFPSIMFSTMISRESSTTETTCAVHAEIPQDADMQYTIRLLESNSSITELPLEEYVLGVVLKEMPADFDLEALKAQAVAARTYTLRRCMQGGKHDNADVCSDASCCQAYLSEDSYAKNGGEAQNIERVKSAVADTEGLVLLYNGQLIEATYFSASGGMTESAVAVWGSDIPYLQATDSPGEENSKHHTTTLFIESDDFEKALNISSTESSDSYIQNIQYTDGGGIESVSICGKSFTGPELRELLNLKSTAISITPTGNGVAITTKGYGHRVGLSQYGADAMAREGYSYTEILLHYYTGVEIGQLGDTVI